MELLLMIHVAKQEQLVRRLTMRVFFSHITKVISNNQVCICCVCSQNCIVVTTCTCMLVYYYNGNGQMACVPCERCVQSNTLAIDSHVLNETHMQCHVMCVHA